ncbi:MFS transporter [Streptomyces sp. NPDC013978]|uniref:MFS transporter n=1 Tax=Streptomyces sp. NPDC013978 TaxID=3364869 RepID=UPI0036F6AFE8
MSGAAAPILLVTARLLQGLSVGGEYSTSATYMSEVASPGRRGYYSSFQPLAPPAAPPCARRRAPVCWQGSRRPTALGTQFLDVRSLISTGVVPLHPGAVAAYRELHG